MLRDWSIDVFETSGGWRYRVIGENGAVVREDGNYISREYAEQCARLALMELSRILGELAATKEASAGCMECRTSANLAVIEDSARSWESYYDEFRGIHGCAR